MKDNSLQHETGKVQDQAPVFCFHTNSNKKGVYPAVFAGHVNPFRYFTQQAPYMYVVNGLRMGVVKP